MHVDIHQHVWPDVFVEELRRRSQPPRLDGWTLLTAGEPPFTVNPVDHDIGRRAAQAAHDGAGLRVEVERQSPRGGTRRTSHSAGLVPCGRAKLNVQTDTWRPRRAANASSLYLAIGRSVALRSLAPSSNVRQRAITCELWSTSRQHSIEKDQRMKRLIDRRFRVGECGARRVKVLQSISVRTAQNCNGSHTPRIIVSAANNAHDGCGC